MCMCLHHHPGASSKHICGYSLILSIRVPRIKIEGQGIPFYQSSPVMLQIWPMVLLPVHYFCDENKPLFSMRQSAPIISAVVLCISYKDHPDSRPRYATNKELGNAERLLKLLFRID